MDSARQMQFGIKRESRNLSLKISHIMHELIDIGEEKWRVAMNEVDSLDVFQTNRIEMEKQVK